MRHFTELNTQIWGISLKAVPNQKIVGFHGPWLEDCWHDLEKVDLAQFGHFIPLFVPWVRMWIFFRRRGQMFRYRAIVLRIFHLLSSHFFYVTVTQNGDGIEGSDKSLHLPSNLFILSQGGKGHVPLPLWLHQMNPSDYLIRRNYHFDALFMGTPRNHAIRFRMIKIMQKVFPNSSFFSHPVSNWRKQYGKAKVILCPRGWGRNSYRLTEVLQMGMIPVYVYNDLIWLPYYDSIEWLSFAYVAHIDELESILEHIKWELTPEKVVSMRHKVISFYSTHWSAEGVIQQIFKLLNYGFGRSDLRCARYSTVRDEHQPR
jgi:hypothetical protein